LARAEKITAHSRHIAALAVDPVQQPVFKRLRFPLCLSIYDMYTEIIGYFYMIEN
jgi:hypothetical protein